MTDNYKLTEDAIVMATEGGCSTVAEIVDEIRTNPVVREACIKQMISGIVEGVLGARQMDAQIAAREVTLPSEAHVHFRADPPQELDHSGWPKHIRDNIRSPGFND